MYFSWCELCLTWSPPGHLQEARSGQWCAGKQPAWGKEGWFIAFAGFHGVITPTMSDFKLPRWCQATSWKFNHLLSWASARDSKAPPILGFQGKFSQHSSCHRLWDFTSFKKKKEYLRIRERLLFKIFSSFFPSSLPSFLSFSSFLAFFHPLPSKDTEKQMTIYNHHHFIKERIF